MRTLRHGRRTHAARVFVTFLLGVSMVAAVASAFLALVEVPAFLEGDVAASTFLLDRLAAVSASVTVALVLLRLAFDRYLERVDVTAVFLAMELATCRRT